jgi:hypothetical protein
MKRYDIDGRIPTLAVALSEYMNVDEMKVLATLTRTSAPTRKAELVEHICKYLEGDRLRIVWQGLNDLQKAAVPEVVHSGGTSFPAERLPAPVFRATADLQARRRLGLTATLVREDGCEGDVFALIGPKRFDVPW